MKHDICMVSILHYVYYLPNNRATTSWRKLNTNLVYSWAPNPGYRLFLVPVCSLIAPGQPPNQSRILVLETRK